jgi:hypothetical protein
MFIIFLTESDFLIFFQTFYHFLLFFRRLKRRPTGEGGWGVAGEKKIMLCVAHIQYAPLIFEYAPLIYELSVAHIALCATHNPGRSLLVGPT